MAATRRPTIPIMTPLPPPLLSPVRPPKIIDQRAIIARKVMAPAMVAATVITRVSLLPTWAISWAITADSSSRFKIRIIPVVAATAPFCGFLPVANALGESF